MEKRTKRVRGSNWNHAQTMALAELKREAFLHNEDGRLVWERIAHALSSKFPGQNRTSAQCRRRWDTLVKVYKYIEDYCIITGAQDHRELDEGELASMKLDTAYQQDWYDIVEQVCSQRKRKESCDHDLRLAKQSNGSSPASHSVELPEHPMNKYTHCSSSTSKSVTHHEQMTPEFISYAHVSCSPSFEEKLGPEEEFLRFMNGNDAFMFEEQLWQHGHVYHEGSQEPQTLESANQLPYTLPVENGAQLREPLQYNWWDLIESGPFETSVEIEKSVGESKLTDMSHRYRTDSNVASNALVAQPKEPRFDHVRNILPRRQKASAPYPSSCPGFAYPPAWYLASSQPNSLPCDVLEWQPHFRAHSFVPPHYECRPRAYYGGSYAGGRGFGPAPRNHLPSANIKSSSGTVNQDRLVTSATKTSPTPSRSSDSTISRQKQRWSLKVILLNILRCCHTCDRE